MTDILQWPDRRLAQVSKPVDDISQYEELATQMREVVLEELPDITTIGLSAVQLGVLVRLIIIRYGDSLITMYNPEIIKLSSQIMKSPETCLSVSYSKMTYIVDRHKRCKVSYMNESGGWRSLKAADLTSRCVQHEVDHLNGITIANWRQSRMK